MGPTWAVRITDGAGLLRLAVREGGKTIKTLVSFATDESPGQGRDWLTVRGSGLRWRRRSSPKVVGHH